MNLDTSINSPEMCGKLRCKMDASDEMACDADICGETCKLSRPECREIALEVGISQLQLAECELKRGDITQEQYDALKAERKEGGRVGGKGVLQRLSPR